MRRLLLAALAATVLANCEAPCFENGSLAVCPGDPCSRGTSDEYCVERRHRLFCSQDDWYVSVPCEACYTVYDLDRRHFTAACSR